MGKVSEDVLIKSAKDFEKAAALMEAGFDVEALRVADKGYQHFGGTQAPAMRQIRDELKDELEEEVREELREELEPEIRAELEEEIEDE